MPHDLPFTGTCPPLAWESNVSAGTLEVWDEPPAEVQHQQSPHPFVVPAGLHAHDLIPDVSEHRLSPLVARFAGAQPNPGVLTVNNANVE